ATASEATNSRSSAARRSGRALVTTSIAALPTATPSAVPRSAATCSGELMPKPTTIGRAVWRRTRPTNSATSDASARRAPVTPVSDTQYTKPWAFGSNFARRSSGALDRGAADERTADRHAGLEHVGATVARGARPRAGRRAIGIADGEVPRDGEAPLRTRARERALEAECPAHRDAHIASRARI